MKLQNNSVLLDTSIIEDKFSDRVLICERNGKYIYKTDKPDLVVQEFRTNGTADKNPEMEKLDTLRNEISSYLFEYLDGFHIPTHFVTRLSDIEMSVRRTELIPIAVKVFNIVNGALGKRLGLKDNIQTELPIIEHYYINGQKNGSWINEHHVYALSLATPEEFKQMNRIATKANAVLRGLCDRRQLILAETQFEFGRFKNQIVLINEISPLTCHFLDLTSDNKAKRDRFLIDNEGAADAISQLRDRLLLRG